jgi:hypothetical protein
MVESLVINPSLRKERGRRESAALSRRFERPRVGLVAVSVGDPRPVRPRIKAAAGPD